MALTTCKDCGSEISHSAKTCPHCGARRPTERFTVNCLTALIMIPLMLFGCGKCTEWVFQHTSLPEAEESESTGGPMSEESEVHPVEEH